MMRLTPAVKNLIVLNVGIFIIQLLSSEVAVIIDGRGVLDMDLVSKYGALFHYGDASFNFKAWQIFTHAFLHGGIPHLFFNMLGLFFFGPILEATLGERKFLTLYIVCILGAAAAHMVFANYYLHQYIPAVGASGAVVGILIATAIFYPNMEVQLYFLFPLKLKYLAILYVAFDLFGGVSNRAGDNIAHFAHLGGALFAYLLVYYWKKNGGMYNRY